MDDAHSTLALIIKYIPPRLIFHSVVGVNGYAASQSGSESAVMVEVLTQPETLQVLAGDRAQPDPLMFLHADDPRLEDRTPLACLQAGEIDRAVWAATCYGEHSVA